MKKIIFAVALTTFFATETLAANVNQLPEKPQKSFMLAQVTDDYGQEHPSTQFPKYRNRGTLKGSQLDNIDAKPYPKTFFISVEYSAPYLSHNRKPYDFKTNVFEKQMKDFENIALGINLRLHDYFGANLNWAQTELNSGSLKNVSLSRPARLNLDQYNFSGLLYAPIIKNQFDVFAELGGAVLFSRLKYVDSTQASYSNRSDRIRMFYGAGFQFAPFLKSQDLIRFSAQKYSGKLLTGNDFYTVRFGYLKAF
jgi:hypothetical protein